MSDYILTKKDHKEFINNLTTLKDILRWLVKKFNDSKLFFGHGTDNAWDEAVALLLFFNKLSSQQLNIVLDAKLTDPEKEELYLLITDRINNRKPLPYITNRANFCDLEFYVDERVLIPRSPIAELIYNNFEPWLQLENLPDDKLNILEIGTGSGCIAIAIVQHFLNNGINIKADAVDINSNALEVAKLNSKKYYLDECISFINSDLYNNLDKNSKYDLIISNPPYVDIEDMADLPAEFLHEPKMALEAGVDGLDLVKKIINQAAQYLSDNGILIVEVGNSMNALEEAYPEIDFVWLEFEHGGHGIFLLTKQQLEDINGTYAKKH